MGAAGPRSFETFDAQARDGGLIPVWRDVLLDADTPVAAFHRLRRGRFAFLLESAPAGGETWARYTFMGTEPYAAWRLRDGVVESWTEARGWHDARTPADPMADLRAILSQWPVADAPDVGAFWAGAVGYFAYDVVRHFERLPNAPPRGIDAPDAIVMFPRTVVIMDNLRAQARVVCGVPVPIGADAAARRAAYDAGMADVERTIAHLRGGRPLPPLDLDPNARPAEGRSSMSRDAFMAGVARIKEHILSGDVFQALLARRISVPHDFEGTDLYRAIRALNPSPYMFHLLLDGVELVGSSPELLVRVADDRVVVRPIAGTRRRAGTPEEDDRLAEELLADEKERAEHVMLVDLGRNDVGRVSEYGSVQVTDLMTVERYSHVLHIVSQVEGRLPAGTSALDVLRATFPAGTMTGAPKVRSMEIIDALEPERRGPYAGAIGYIAAGDRRMDLAITIRTCVIAGGEANVQAGGGIVADSDPAMEWEETENKARAMLTAIGRVRAAARSPRDV
ncbi:MAG: anthranilate synthase component I family protein [Gemmatimonadaceae bacterium]|nr:anthranilate synthase component I family protein [Gemmatimonadaceae bacterium]